MTRGLRHSLRFVRAIGTTNQPNAIGRSLDATLKKRVHHVHSSVYQTTAIDR